MYYNQDGGEDDWVNPPTSTPTGPRAMTEEDFERFTADLIAGVARFESRIKTNYPLKEVGLHLSTGLELSSLLVWMSDYNIDTDRANTFYAKAYGVFLSVVQASRDQAASTVFGRQHKFPSARQYAVELRSSWDKYLASNGGHPLHEVFLEDYAEWL